MKNENIDKAQRGNVAEAQREKAENEGLFIQSW